MHLPKLAIFDMDGILFDTERNMYEANTEVMARYGYEQNFSDYMKTVGTAGDTFFRILREIHGPDYPAETIARESAVLAHQRILENGPPVKEGIPELLSFFRNRGVRMCVASSTRVNTVRTYLELAGLADYFDFIVGGDMVTRSKPDPEVHYRCLDQAGGIPAGDSLVLEDSENGIHAAFNAGIPVICIVDMKEPAPRYAEMATAVVHSALGVPGLME